MQNQSASDPLPCGVCGLLLQDDRHESAGDCIRGLRKAMLAQRKAAELLSFEVSTRYLAVLEELALRPDVGIPYHVWSMSKPFDESKMAVHHQHVSGVFTAIVRKFQEMGNWSPLKERDERIILQDHMISQLISLLPVLLTPNAREEINREHLTTLRIIEQLAKQLGVPLPDLRDF